MHSSVSDPCHSLAALRAPAARDRRGCWVRHHLQTACSPRTLWGQVEGGVSQQCAIPGVVCNDFSGLRARGQGQERWQSPSAPPSSCVLQINFILFINILRILMRKLRTQETRGNEVNNYK